MKQEKIDRIKEKAEKCKEIYEERGFYTMGDVASWVGEDVTFKEILKVLSDQKQLNEIYPKLAKGYFYINDNWIESFSEPEDKEKKQKVFI